MCTTVELSDPKFDWLRTVTVMALSVGLRKVSRKRAPPPAEDSAWMARETSRPLIAWAAHCAPAVPLADAAPEYMASLTYK